MMTVWQLYLAKYAEECHEVVEALLGVIEDSGNIQSIRHAHEELDDLRAVMEELSVYGLDISEIMPTDVDRASEADQLGVISNLMKRLSAAGKIALKAQQFGLDEVCPGIPFSNIQRLGIESKKIIDLIQDLNAGGFNYKTSDQRVNNKKAKMQHYMKYSQSLRCVK